MWDDVKFVRISLSRFVIYNLIYLRQAQFTAEHVHDWEMKESHQIKEKGKKENTAGYIAYEEDLIPARIFATNRALADKESNLRG